MVGGLVRNNLWYPEGKKVYSAVTADQQKKAVAFLNEHAFQTPKALIEPDILDRLESHSTSSPPPLVTSRSKNLLTIAFEEIAEGKIDFASKG